MIPEIVRRTRSKQAKPVLAWRSWRLTHFSSAVLPHSTLSTAQPAPSGENAPDTQANNSWLTFGDKRCMQARSSGFTLVELTVTIPIFIAVLGVLIWFLVSLYTSLLQKNNEASLALEAQQALTTIQDDLYFGRNFAEAPSAAMVDADGPGGAASGWAFDTSPDDTLIVYEIALDKVRQDPDREIVYQNTASSGNSCAPDDVELNPPVLNNLIYYVQNDTDLRRRILVPDPINARCSEPFKEQTCNTSKTRLMQTSGGEVSVDCAADTTLTSNVSSFEIDYYDADNNLIDMSDGGSPLQAERITVKLTLAKTVGGQTAQFSSQLTITKINGGDPDIQ